MRRSRMESFPKCQVCRKRFTLEGPSPYLLPCLHAACEKCVTSTVGGVISCSTCQREVNLTETHLQKDVVRQREIFHLTVQYRPSELLCTHENDGNQAVCWCQECRTLLCEYCQNEHEDVQETRQHSLQEIRDIQLCSSDNEKYCDSHKTHVLDLWDKSCSSWICSRCRQSDHVGHDVEDGSLAAESAKAEMAVQEKNVMTAEDGHKTAIEILTKRVKFTDETYKMQHEKIGHIVSSMKADLDQMGKEVTIELQQQAEQIKFSLDKKIKVYQSRFLGCKMTTEYIHKALLYSSNHDIVALKKTIKETTDQCVYDVPSEETEKFILPELPTERLERLKSMVTSSDDNTAREPDSSTRRCTPGGPTNYADTESETRFEEMYQKLKKDKTLLWTAAIVIIIVGVLFGNIYQNNTNKMEKSLDSVTSCSEKMSTLGIPDGVSPHLLISDTNVILHCTTLGYDKNKVNLRKAHISSEGYLVNKPGTETILDSSGRFVNYMGTCSTSPFSRTGSPQYLEVVVRIHFNKPVFEKFILMELGVCRGNDRDSSDDLPDNPHTYSLTVSRCSSHGSVCRQTWNDGEEVSHLSDVLPNTTRSRGILHYGLLYDDSRSKIVFIDVKENTVISVFRNVNSDEALWPMFGVSCQDRVSVEMRLVVGEDIKMTDDKRKMIFSSLVDL